MPSSTIFIRTASHRPFWIVLGILVCLLILLRVVREGMFFDGLTYADLSRNMAEGIGTIWRPKYTETPATESELVEQSSMQDDFANTNFRTDALATPRPSRATSDETRRQLATRGLTLEDVFCPASAPMRRIGLSLSM